jgi:hypothetical protein
MYSTSFNGTLMAWVFMRMVPSGEQLPHLAFILRSLSVGVTLTSRAGVFLMRRFILCRKTALASSCSHPSTNPLTIFFLDGSGRWTRISWSVRQTPFSSA